MSEENGNKQQEFNNQIPSIAVSYHPLLGIQVQCFAGIENNEMLALFILEKARDAIKAMAAQKAQSGIVGATQMPNLRTQ